MVKHMEPPCEAAGVAIPAPRAWYGASFAEFLSSDPDVVIGRLAKDGDFAVLPTQRDAWLAEITILRDCLDGLTGSLFLEFNIPRMGRRVDAVLLIGPVVFVVEFKLGEPGFDRAAVEQVWDYALDLKNFHEASHTVLLVPILIATAATQSPAVTLHMDEDKVFRPILVHLAGLATAIKLTLQSVAGGAVNPEQWSRAPYRPTPTIVEAARALYAQHSVETIARYDAGAHNLRTTSRRIEELVDEAKTEQRKVICFVTGVPGAGKTLVGLNIATQRRDQAQPTHAVFLSGNAPLVAVLCEALTRDELARRKQNGERVWKGKVAESIKAFIQNVHHFRDDALIDCETQPAREAFSKLAGRYPIVATRDLNSAKQWIRSRARRTERYGLLASSKAQRLKPHAIDIRVDVDPVHWFLDDKEDTRSSYYLEDAASEFQVQGLELDWTCVTWDGDLRFTGTGWSHHNFRGYRWCNIANPENRVYLRNAYRVLLTRARQGMVLFVPPGEPTDPTRSPEFYDSTFNYLRELGILTLA